MDIAQAINDYGFPIVLSVGMGYFIYYIWWFIGEKIDPALSNMHVALIRVIDKMRRLDQDLIRLQQKVDVVLEYRARQQVLDNAKEKEALNTLNKGKNK
jgi:hypothetical protein|tara:strand:- start:2423 stop:2719 length:297 start_codon:yes stop_codon:yes gene_type:complete